MFDENQLVKIKWNNTNKDWYISKGYIYTKRYDEFEVKAKDLCDGSAARVNVICDYCGKGYDTQYATVKKSIDKVEKLACKHCASTKVHKKKEVKRRKKLFSTIIEKCKEKNYELLTDERDVKTVRQKITIKTSSGFCEMPIVSLLDGRECIIESYKNRNYKKISKDIINSALKDDGNTWLNPNEYTNCTVRCLKIRCACGNIFTTSFSNYKKAGVNRCRACVAKQSSGEVIIQNVLDELNIAFEREKRFDDCRDKKPLPFDYYLNDYNMVIEFDGQGHYMPIFENYDSTVAHDKIKNKYCADNNINLLRIPYWEGNKIKEVISDKIRELNSLKI